VTFELWRLAGAGALPSMHQRPDLLGFQAIDALLLKNFLTDNSKISLE
jgi:hypothetical protein